MPPKKQLLDAQKLGLIFQSRPDILQGIKEAADSPARVTIFNEIATFVLDQISGSTASTTDEPSSKRRRVDIRSSTTNGGVNGATTSAADEEVLLEIKEISLSIPQRKKFDLCFTANHLYARAPNTTVPVQGIVYAWRDIEHAFLLPVPEKAQQQHNYVLFPRNTALLAASTAKPDSPPSIEPIVFTVPATAPKTGTILGPLSSQAAAVSDSYTTLLTWALSSHLPVKIVSADPKIFHSEVRQPHRPAEKAVHVKAFRGSKDGYLYFLPTGILWAFKKPLLFLPLDRIVAVSYTSVLQRTFNMVVETDAGEEVEFGMIDQEDYGGIDTNYIKRHRLQDRSLAEQRKAKRELAENNVKAEENGVAGGEGEEDDGLTELERAQKLHEQQLQDEEDEDEEDYDPGSDGESEGSGESSEDDDEDGDGDGGGDDDEDEDEELGDADDE